MYHCEGKKINLKRRWNILKKPFAALHQIETMVLRKMTFLLPQLAEQFVIEVPRYYQKSTLFHFLQTVQKMKRPYIMTEEVQNKKLIIQTSLVFFDLLQIRLNRRIGQAIFELRKEPRLVQSSRVRSQFQTQERDDQDRFL